jgi:hypothetical protein
MGVIVKTCCAYPIDGIEHACAVSVTCLSLGRCAEAYQGTRSRQTRPVSTVTLAMHSMEA